ncbi:hypothetical protein BHE97_04925 [Aeromicrobium sp. PE09-221]|uniref:non-ribosomal peptide synthetase n=1 Tax=Aeromicrobium sp. PE09-221 TaxID=1898043 RepID=UPI000B3E4A6F|nr:non-ribosomal peptide synthetase [Aeromicrobium sp. PE09-221]OUZ11195.1 hypothetical protein BHE97_04925 [Aeromicrobium sp. PE09-221]
MTRGGGDDEKVRAEVLGLLGEVLGEAVENADPAVTLAELGLESRQALRLRRLVEERFGKAVALVDLTGERTVHAVVTAVRDAAPAVSLPLRGERLRPSLDEGRLTEVQAAYWAGRDPELDLGGVATYWYNEYESVPATRPEEYCDRLEQAWSRLIDHHPALRLDVTRDGRQLLRDSVDWVFERVDLRDAADADDRAGRLREQRSHRVLTGEDGPLFAVGAVFLPGGRVRVMVGLDALIADLTSWRLLMRQWGHLVDDPDHPLEPSTVSFVEHAAQVGATDEDRRWWRDRAVTLPPAPSLSVNRARANRRFVRHRTRIGAETWAAVRHWAADHGVTATGTSLACYALALDRFGTGGRHTLALTLAGRPDHVGAEHTVGQFAQTGLLACPDPEERPGDGFAGYARDIGRGLFDLLDHASVGSVEVRRLAGRDPSAADFPIVFTSGIGLGEDHHDGWLGEWVYGVSQTPQVLLDHLVWEEGGELVLTMDAVEGAFDDGTVEGVLAMVAGLIETLADRDAWWSPALGWDPSGCLPAPRPESPFAGAGPLIADPARRWRTPEPAVIADGIALGHDALAERADVVTARLRTAGAGTGDLVVVALPKGAAQIVAVLGTVAAGAGYVPVDPQWPASRLQSVVRRSGARWAIVPDGAKPEALLGLQTLVRLTADGRTTGPGPSEQAADDPGARPDDLAYAIFTSGSTGEPKGVAVTHRQARCTIDDIVRRYGVGPDDRVLAVSALTFDLSVFDVFGLLGAGGAMVLPATEELRDPAAWARLVGEHGVTIWNTAPALLEMLVEHAEHDPVSAEHLASLRVVMLSGDWIPVTLPDRLRALVPGASVHSLGGATEASIWSITYPIGRVDPDWSSIPYGRPLDGQSFHVLADGRPCHVGETGELFIGGDGVAEGYVGDPEQTADRFGVHPVLGERLYRTGDLGRWRSDATIEFLGRVDRQIKIQGFRIELGEVEAALARCERVRQAVAASVPGPDGRPRLVAWVAAPDDPAEGPRRLREEVRSYLPSYMIPSRIQVLPALPVTANGKVDHGSLPAAFARPVADETVRPGDSVLPAEGEEGMTPEDVPADTAPAGDVPGLAAVAYEVLGASVALDRTLLESGATSLDAVRLANAVEDACGWRPPVRELLGERTVRDVLEDVPRSATVVAETPIEPMAESEPAYSAPDAVPPLPETSVVLRVPVCSPDPEELMALTDWLRAIERWTKDAGRTAQTRWTSRGGGVAVEVALGEPSVHPRATRDHPASTTASGHVSDSGPFAMTEMQLSYLLGRADDWLGAPVAPHYYTEVDLPGIRAEDLQHAVDEVVAVHPMLRARATADARQTVLAPDDPSGRVPVEVRDLRGLGDGARESSLREIREAESHRVVDPMREPGLRLAVSRLDDGVSRVHLGLDLLFCDATSAVVLVDSLHAALGGESIPRPEGEFRRWIADLSATRDGDRRRAAEAHMAARAATLPPPPELPLTAPVEGHVRFERREHRFEAGWWRPLRDAVSGRGTTPTGLLLAALGAALGRVTNGQDHTVVVTVFDRPAAHNGVIGDYTTTVLAALPGGGGSLPESARVLQEELWADLEHAVGVHGVHGNHTLRELARLGRSSRFPVAFSSGIGSSVGGDGVSRDAGRLLERWGTVVHAVSQTPNVALDVQAFEDGDDLVVRWDGVDAAFPPGFLDASFTDFLDELRAAPAAYAEAETPRAAPARRAGPVRDVASAIREHLAEELGCTVSAVDASARFFDLGATSLTVVQLQRRLAEDGIDVTVLDFFAHPTLERLAAAITESHAVIEAPRPARGGLSAAHQRGERRRRVHRDRRR